MNTAVASSWVDGVISFENEPLGEVMKKLEKHFDVDISIDQELAVIRFTGKIFDESIYKVMEYIYKTKPIKYNYDKKMKKLKITTEK